MRIPLPKDYYQISDILFKGNKIRVYRFGIGKKKVLSLPGFPHSGLIYLYFLLKYDLKKVTFITLDIPGWVGNSDNIFKDCDYNEDTVVEMLDVIIKKFNLDIFSVIGYSFGSSLAARLVGEKKYNIEKLALVSPVLHGKQIQDRRWLLDILTSLKFYSYLRFHLNHRFRIYKARLKMIGLDKEALDEYSTMVNNSDPKVLFESLNMLFTKEYVQYLDGFDTSKILVASSRKESKYLRDQAALLRKDLKGENSLYLHGNHEDFILKPTSETVNAVVKFLTD